MNTTFAWLKALQASYQQEREAHKLFGLIYLTPEQRVAILKELICPFEEKHH